ncbi:hypothetical protein [uncultured Oscillibacter sp.]|uniref:hypothetical protein n=1 Tax=uncultured Oscillibacter sp. TaxID=876091 RepID=UPI00280B0F69|nr:hypothetical protein [uncultured Oscillibacter sp.]
MMYLSKGLPVQERGGREFQVSHCGKVYALGPKLEALWCAAQRTPQEVPVGKERFIRRLEQTGLVMTTAEPGSLGHYRLLSDCIICPGSDNGGILRPGRDSRVWTWIKKAGLRLTASELIRLEEQHTKPAPQLLGEDGRQELTERIYTPDTITDGRLATLMERSPARDALVASVLRLLRRDRVFLV